MQYGGNPQQQRMFHMMMQARQGMQQQQQQQQSHYNNLARAQPFVTSLTENDVLLGRGTPCAENEGNVRFRQLVKSRKVEYIAAEKRMRKDAIAREILEVIASRGGKFLRKVESQAELEQLGVPRGLHAKEVWAIVDEDTQVQKVKQALRNKDDAAELMANTTNKKYGEHDVTNRFPRGVSDQSDIHRADCKLQFGTGALERVSSHSSNEEKTASSSSPKVKGLEKGLIKASPGSLKMTTTVMNRPLARDADHLMPPTLHHLASPANPRLLSGRLDPSMALGQGDVMANMMRRPDSSDLRTLQELQRLRFMREQNLMGAGMMGGLGLDGPFGLSEQQQLLRNRQMQAQQQQQMQQIAAAREQAALAAASLQRSSFTAGSTLASSSSAALAARQLQETRRALPKEPAAAPAARKGADSAGERAIGIAQAMKRAEAFSPAESLEVSHMETLILSVLCSHGLPVWTPEAHTKSFVSLPTFAKRLDWTWYGFASVLKLKASSTKNDVLALEAATEYQKDPRELATKTIMLLERLRRHCDASASAKKQTAGLGMRVPLWLDRELSRWAMTLDIADPTGRPVPFSSTDFVAEHAEYKQDPAVVATAAFDPPLADDVVEQVAMLTRLRSVFVKTKGRELYSKLEAAAKKVEAWDDQPRGWDVEPYGTRDLLLCDRLLSEGFSGVLASTDELGSEYQLSGASPRRFPSYESVGLTKSSIQQRASQIARELHVTEEQKELQRLQLDRMEKFAQSVLLSQPAAAGEGRSLALPKKRKGTAPSSRSNSPVDPASKKAKTTNQ